jgi:hypothetical protein
LPIYWVAFMSLRNPVGKRVDAQRHKSRETLEAGPPNLLVPGQAASVFFTRMAYCGQILPAMCTTGCSLVTVKLPETSNNLL